ncbi:MAG: transposase [Candidatus Thermoplasmatota archaeon]|jgi:transposase|nr:transposase [Candidatus Thermoplasmatota archaeon]
MMMADGIPIHHQVFPGNVIDPKTLKPIHSDLRERFHIGRVIFIGDRAFGRKPSLQYLDKNEYITAVYRWDQPYRNMLMNTKIDQNNYMKDLELYANEIEVEWKTNNLSKSEIKRIKNRRAIVVYSPERERYDISDIDEKVSVVRTIIDSGKKGSDLTDALGKLKSYTIKGKGLNEKRIGIMKKLAGRFMIISDTNLSVTDIVKGYKDLWKIERSFRTMKSFLEIRPVYHRKEERIEAHVFVCVLSLLISRLFEKALKEKMTISRISEVLSELKAIPVKIPEGEIVLRSESESAQKILEELNIPYPGKIFDSVPTN